MKKIVKKFDELIQKTSNKELDTFDEIADILINLMKMQTTANHNELMQRVSKSATFGSMDEIQNFLNGYFDFHNTLLSEFERMEDLEDDVFDKEILSFTKTMFSLIAKDKLQARMLQFIEDVIGTVMQEYPIAELIENNIGEKALVATFGNEEVALLFMTVSLFLGEMQRDDLKYNDIVEMSESTFVFCMAMNGLRRENFLNAQENTTMQNAANSISYNVGRNDPCPCGSGRKYKKCCMNKHKAKPLETIQFEEPTDILPALKKEEMHEFYTIWSQFLNFVSGVYAGVSENEYIKIYDQKANGEYFLTDEAMKEHHYLTIRNFLDEYFFMLVEHFIDDNRVSKTNQKILFELRDSYKNADVFSFEMFKNGNAIFYDPRDKICFYAYKTLYDYSQVYPKGKLIQSMFFSYKGRIITDGIAASPKVEMGENMQNILKEEYEEQRKNLTFTLSKNEKPSKNVYQLKISIKDAKPPIWRRVVVEPTMNFAELHDVIQTIFNWEDYHLYSFRGMDINYTSRESIEEDMFGGENDMPSDEHMIATELQREKEKIKYIYDFGDNWEHEILLEKILLKDESLSYPICTGGRREGPVEDSGGIYYFNQIVEAIENPTPQNRCFLGEDGENWYEGFVPSYFDKNMINALLSSEDE